MFPAIYFILGRITLKELSIFIDESGDFGNYDFHSPYYIISMIFHDQGIDLSSPILKLDYDLSSIGFPNHCVHTGPIIRRENEYFLLRINERRKIFNYMISFVKACDIKFTSFSIEKKHILDPIEMFSKLSKQISNFITDHYQYFLSYDLVKIYYDNGQTELTKLLASIFNALLPRVDMKRVIPSEYRLFQAADLICTLELIKLKLDASSVSASEMEFFGNVRHLKKNYLKPLSKKRYL